MIKTRYLGAELVFINRKSEIEWTACYKRFPKPGFEISFFGCGHNPESAAAMAQKKIKMSDAERNRRNDVAV
jgi:hypothetical protein